MLVLSRKVGEEILIGENIRLTILSTKGERVRIGIAAPPEVRVDRYELHLRRMEGQVDGKYAPIATQG